METVNRLVVAMAQKCRFVIEKSERDDHNLPEQLRRRHLQWMCGRIEEHANDWPEIKLHRWIGFVQSGMLANRMLDFEGAKVMFDAAKQAFAPITEEQDLIDHLNPANSFELDVGGEG